MQSGRVGHSGGPPNFSGSGTLARSETVFSSYFASVALVTTNVLTLTDYSSLTLVDIVVEQSGGASPMAGGPSRDANVVNPLQGSGNIPTLMSSLMPKSVAGLTVDPYSRRSRTTVAARFDRLRPTDFMVKPSIRATSRL